MNGSVNSVDCCISPLSYAVFDKKPVSIAESELHFCRYRYDLHVVVRLGFCAYRVSIQYAAFIEISFGSLHRNISVFMCLQIKITFLEKYD